MSFTLYAEAQNLFGYNFNLSPSAIFAIFTTFIGKTNHFKTTL